MYPKSQSKWIKHLDFSILDVILLQCAFILAYYTRHNNFNLFYIGLYRTTMFVLFLASLLLPIVFNLYHNILRRKFLEELKSILIIVLGSASILMAFLFFSKMGSLFARSVVAYFSVYGVVLLCFGRTVWKSFLRHKGVSEQRQRSIFIVASLDSMEQVIHSVNEHSYGHLRIGGLVALDNNDSVGRSILDQEIVCSIDELISFVQTRWADEILLYLPEGTKPDPEMMEELLLMGITTHQVLDVKTERDTSMSVEDVAGYLCLTESIHFASPIQLFVKRTMDIIGALMGLVLTAFLLIIVGPAIYFTDPGPVFFKQKRVGKNGRVFDMYKFRSMYQDAEERKQELVQRMHLEEQMMFKMENDPRILGSGPDGTRKGIGWLIRKSSIDEFPQFWNVLKGDLSLVGTRPPTLDEWERYQTHHRARMSIKPGITGLWQVSGRSSITDFEEVVKLDMEYINHWSLLEDLRILLKTIIIVVTGEGAK